MVEGARLESVYTGNCIKGSNPLVSAEISYFKEGEIKKPSKIKGFSVFRFLSLPIFTPFYCWFAGVIRGVLFYFTRTPATLRKSLSINILYKRMYVFYYAIHVIL